MQTFTSSGAAVAAALQDRRADGALILNKGERIDSVEVRKYLLTKKIQAAIAKFNLPPIILKAVAQFDSEAAAGFAMQRMHDRALVTWFDEHCETAIVLIDVSDQPSATFPYAAIMIPMARHEYQIELDVAKALSPLLSLAPVPEAAA